MHKLRSLSAATLAELLSRWSARLKSTGGRPSAPLGSRILLNPDDIFKHNMWDHVQWTEEDKENACQKAKENSSEQIPLKEQGKFDIEACQYWDTFYETHQDKFFKNRKWLFLEFPELLPSDAESQTRNTLTRQHEHISSTDLLRHSSHHQESCKAADLENNEGPIQSSAFPGQHTSFKILEIKGILLIFLFDREKDAFLYCCDFSPRAIQLVKEHPDYDDSVCHAFVHNICEEVASFPFPPQSLDVILAVFVLSSIHPERMQGVVNRLSTYLKHGGVFLFRDYGRYDFSQLRFKKGRCLSENFYTRGDGTCVYFFTKEEVHHLFSNAGLEEVQNLEDRRLQVNRGKKVAMHRVWMQSKYRKTHPSSTS
uniref:tRNA N(3)-cytidine methyltransferase n=1 Tax=Sphaeramia orbicularis TaxID=375764 RepID=A0A672Z577_9TELE